MSDRQSSIVNRQSLSLVFFGSGMYTIPIIETLFKHGLKLVVTTENETDSGERQKTFADYLKTKQIPFITSDLDEISDIERIKQVKPDVGVLASYGVIIKPEVISLFPKGIFNIHPSLLPKYKGASPIQTAILNGDSETGVTIHFLDNELDHGPIAMQKIYKLDDRETTLELKNKLFKLGAEMMDEILNKLEKGEKIVFKNQDHSKEVFTKRRFSREDGKIDLNSVPNPEQLDRMIRAFYPWPGVWFETKINGKKQRVKLLPEEKIQVEGKRVMSYKDFVNGYKEEGQLIVNKLGITQ